MPTYLTKNQSALMMDVYGGDIHISLLPILYLCKSLKSKDVNFLIFLNKLLKVLIYFHMVYG